MPSIQHNLLKLSLKTAGLAFSFSKPSVQGMRSLLELMSLYTYMPWGVHFRPLDIDGMYAEWITPSDARPEKVVLYLHGGAYALGSPNTHRAFVGHLAKEIGANALVIDYRKAPENPFPAALEDAIKAYDWLLKEDYLPKNIIFAGDSAGGGLALAALVNLRDKQMPLPAAALLFSPWVDLTLSGESILQNKENDKILEAWELHEIGDDYAGAYPLDHPLVSPLFANLEGLPPLLIQASDGEVLYSDATRLRDKAEAAGVRVELQIWHDLIHWWHLFGKFLPEATEAIEEAARFARKTWRIGEFEHQLKLTEKQAEDDKAVA
ncbi:MAG: hypothetical protein KatS3mg033_1835 [Thermonema sp.]|uniref:alpha/beta hydrolase n=1 Tax=Thermonema sp. TaxID=2231181 RepID=UPI0021DF1ED0|nr:alpha/beta hydrolase [Thermonema sp.]GIV40035.1 MAG: hypothetical protein KatS3mg033_1835 [Thermonema sp.]